MVKITKGGMSTMSSKLPNESTLLRPSLFAWLVEIGFNVTVEEVADLLSEVSSSLII